jgi:hypothetical protein
LSDWEMPAMMQSNVSIWTNQKVENDKAVEDLGIGSNDFHDPMLINSTSWPNGTDWIWTNSFIWFMRWYFESIPNKHQKIDDENSHNHEDDDNDLWKHWNSTNSEQSSLKSPFVLLFVHLLCSGSQRSNTNNLTWSQRVLRFLRPKLSLNLNFHDSPSSSILWLDWIGLWFWQIFSIHHNYDTFCVCDCWS